MTPSLCSAAVEMRIHYLAGGFAWATVLVAGTQYWSWRKRATVDAGDPVDWDTLASCTGPYRSSEAVDCVARDPEKSHECSQCWEVHLPLKGSGTRTAVEAVAAAAGVVEIDWVQAGCPCSYLASVTTTCL